MERSIVRIPAYIAFGFAVFLVALVLTFPDQRIKEIATVQIEKQLKGKYDVTIEDLDLWWLSGLELENVKISERVVDPDLADGAAESDSEESAGAGKNGPPEEKPMVVEIPRVAAGLSPLLSVINFAPTVDFLVDLGGGDVSGNYVHSGDGRALEVDIDEIDLAKTPILESLLGVPVLGTLAGEIDLQIHPSRAVVTGGDIRLKGQNLVVDNATLTTDALGPMGFIDVPQTDFGRLDAHLTIARPKGESRSTLKFEEFRFHEGEDVRGQIWGDIELGRGMARSVAKIEMRFQFDDKYIRSNDLSSVLRLGYFREGKNQDWYGFLLWGRLSSPRFKGAPTAAAGPKKTDGGAKKENAEGEKG
jgi:type II secretion system protein N